MKINRTLSFGDIKSAMFLCGPLQSGKTWLLKNTVEYDLYIDLLNEKERQRYLKNPNILFSEAAEINKQNVIIESTPKSPKRTKVHLGKFVFSPYSHR